MELKLAEIQGAKQAFQKIMNADLPVRVAFRLSRMAKLIDEVYTQIEAQRMKLVEKYGAASDMGVTVKPENIQVFQAEFNELLAKEAVNLEIEPIKLDLLEGLKLTALEMLALEKFIVQ